MPPDTHATLEEVEDRLSRLRGTVDQDWLEIARLIDLARRSELWQSRFPSVTAWSEHAGALVGWSLNTVWRMLATQAFIDQELPSVIGAVTSVPPLSPSLAEVLRKIATASPDEARKLIVTLNDRKAVSVRDAREVLERVQAGVTQAKINNRPEAGVTFSGKRALAEDSIQRVNELVRRQLAELSPGREHFKVRSRGRVRTPYFQVNAFATSVGDRVLIDGYRYVPGELRWRSALLGNALAEAAFSATFFSRYWVIFLGTHPDQKPREPSGTQARAFSRGRTDLLKELMQGTEELRIDNLGLAWTDVTGDNLSVIHAPTSDVPVPDRQLFAVHALL